VPKRQKKLQQENHKKIMKTHQKTEKKCPCTSKPIARGQAAARGGPWARSTGAQMLPELAVPKKKYRYKKGDQWLHESQGYKSKG
jgi:hypothetical protein